MLLVHGTTVEIDGRAVLLRGPPGSGKSDLAIRLIDGGARLVADDQTELSLRDGRVIARSPDTIAGLLEVRGLGVVRLPHTAFAPLALIIDLAAPDSIERMPDPRHEAFWDIALPVLRLAPFEASAPMKVRLALVSAKRDSRLP